MSQKGNTNRVALAVAAVAVAVTLVVARGGGDDYVVRAEFKDAAGLRKNSDVKIGGVPGGKITSIELTSRDTAMVTMSLRDGAVPLGSGAGAEARPVNLLGEKYVDLTAGDQARPVPSGHTIGIDDTDAPVELDDVLNMLDPTTRGRLRVIINEAGVGMRGRGTDLNALLDRMPRSVRQATELVESFAADTPRLKNLADEGDRVLASFSRGRDDLTELVDVAVRTLRATDANRADLGQTVRSAPQTLRQLRSSLGELEAASRSLGPAAREVRRSSAPLASTLALLPAFAADAKPAFTATRRVSPTLARLGRQGAPVVAHLEPVSRQLERFSTVLAPFSHVLDEQTNPLLRVFEAWARTIQTRDDVGHLFRTEVVPNEELFSHLAAKATTPRPRRRRQERGSTPAPPAAGATPSEPPAAAPDRRKELVPLPAIVPPLVQKQAEGAASDVNKLLDLLLG